MKRLTYALLCIVGSLFGCRDVPRDKVLPTVFHPTTNDPSHFARDSLLVSYALHLSMTSISKKGYQTKSLNLDAISSPLIDEVEVANIFYDPSRRKMVALVIFRELLIYGINRSADPEASYYDERHSYSAEVLFGIRDSVNQPWELYYSELYLLYGYKDVDRIREDLRQFYFENLKGYTMAIKGVGYKHGSTAFAHNVGEEGFWDDFIWQKDLRLPGLYPFQATRGLVNRDPPWVRTYPLVNGYPEEILRLYRDSKEE